MYQVLARKYRPKNFYELVGQQHVSKALTSALERGRLHHAYLFTGTRGVGKTTIARILAKCLNCETGVTATPCEQCNVCQAVNEGRFIDLIEIDAASRTKVEDTRELLDNVPYAPTQGRFKVYLIDEVHMLSTHSFNALLKTLEEPPAHVKFLFATTDPQKLPITVISRCLQFTLRPLSVEELHDHIQRILTIEQIPFDDTAIWQLAESAQGSVRDSLSLTDQAIAYGQGEIHHHDVKDMLGLIDRHLVYDLLLAIHQNRREDVAHTLLLLRQQSIDVALVLDQLISTLHELALIQYLPDLSLKYNDEINQKIKQLAHTISAQDLQLYYQITTKGRDELNLAVSQMQGFEMCILRLLAFRPLAVNEIIHQPTIAPPHAETSDTTPAQAIEIEQPSDPMIATTSEATTAPINDEVNHDEVNNDVISPPLSETVEQETTTIATEQTIPHQSTIIDLHHLPDHMVCFTGENELIAFDDVPPQTLQTTADLTVKPQGLLYFLGEQALYQLSDDTPFTPSTLAPVLAEETIDSVSTPLTPVESPEPPPTVFTMDLATETRSPQDILTLVPQKITAQWNDLKWEYWLRTSTLSPAIQAVLQNAIMSGSIANSILTIPADYQAMLERFMPEIEQAFSQIDEYQHVQIHYVLQLEPNAQTPLILHQQRENYARQRAKALFLQHEHLAQVVQAFSAEFQQINIPQTISNHTS